MNTEFGSYEDSIAGLFNDTLLPKSDVSFCVRRFLCSRALSSESSLRGRAAASGDGGYRHHRQEHILERTDTDEVFAQIATHGIAPREIVPSADGRFLFAITEGRSLIEVIDVAGKKVVDTINLSSPGPKRQVLRAGSQPAR